MRSRFLCIAIVAVALVAPAPVASANAGLGSSLATLTPQPSGNGRAVAFNPLNHHLFYTNYGDPHIYVTTSLASGTPPAIATLTPTLNGVPIMYGALSWQFVSGTNGNGVLWGGRYDGSGAVDRIDPVTGAVTPMFTIPFKFGESCYFQAPGYVDGLAYDPSDDSLWVSDDASNILYHTTRTGTVLSRQATPSGQCNSGIAVMGGFLWLGLMSGPDTPPYSIARVAKTAPSAILQSFDFGTAAGPEGLAVDVVTFGGCSLWSNQFGSTTLRAWPLPSGLCKGLANAPVTDAIGVLVFNHPGGQGSCTATAVKSANRRVIVTAGHCVTDGATIFTNFRFAPAHTGVIDDLTGCVSNCNGISPYGIWHADASDVVLDQRFTFANPNPQGLNLQDRAYDYAYIVMPDDAAGERIDALVPILQMGFNQGRDQSWLAYGYPGGPPIFSQCVGLPGSENADGSVSGDPPYMTMPCGVLGAGASGGPWLANGGIGGVNSQLVTPFLGSTYMRGTYLGCQAQAEFKVAQALAPGAGPTVLEVSC